YNLVLVRPREVLIPLVTALSVVAIVTVVARRLGGRPQVVAFAITIGAAWFFAYGHIGMLISPSMKRLIANPNLVLLPVWTAVAVLAILGARKVRDGSVATVMLNAAALALVVMTSFTIGNGLRAEPSVSDAASLLGRRVDLDADADKPNVYYLVFDRYMADETLRIHHRFDNGPFLRALERRGFVVPERAYTNYPTTTMSLASSLNMAYLDPVADEVGRDFQLQFPFHEAIKRSRVVRAFKDDGYRYIHIGSWWEPTRTSSWADRRVQTLPVSEFGRALLTTTAVSPFAREILGTADLPDLHRRVASRQFDALARTGRDRGPKFVFAHILMPHPPYVFDRDGNAIDAEPGTIADRMDAYIEQLRYTNIEILEALDQILEDDPDPVIVLQADEGPNPTYWSKNHPDWPNAKDGPIVTKYPIFAAFRFPGVDRAEIPDEVTSVNTFRLVMRSYFGADLPPIEDRMFGSKKGAPYRFVDMTERVKEAVANDE
ncbi:MAG: sulfatase-like hydrolase/transferase, partial [Actinomycetota bacterium]